MKSQKPKKDYLIDDLTKNTHPEPITHTNDYKATDKFKDKHVLIIGGDSGIGKAVAILFAKEGADVSFTYTSNEQEDAENTSKILNKYSTSEAFEIDIGIEEQVVDLIHKIKDVDYLIYNPAEQHMNKSIKDISSEQVHRVFQTNVFGAFYFLINGLDKLKENGAIVFTTSVTAYDGNAGLLEYSSTKGALTSLMRSLSQSKELLDKKIRVNAVAPGPVWTPLIPATIPDHKDNWGEDTTLGKTSQPIDVAYSYIYLCDPHQHLVSGQTLHVNGKKVS